MVSLLASIFFFQIYILKKNETVILQMKRVNIRQVEGNKLLYRSNKVDIN